MRVIDVFVEELDLRELGFTWVDPLATGRPAYHPAVLLKLYIYGHLNRVQSSRRLERETQRNVELMWLTERLTPDHKTGSDHNALATMAEQARDRLPPQGAMHHRCQRTFDRRPRARACKIGKRG